jgi:hypothetical protein
MVTKNAAVSMETLRMTSKFIIRDLFNLPGDVTVLACEGADGDSMAPFKGRFGKIHNGDELRQPIFLDDERKMLNHTRPSFLRAAVTLHEVQLSIEEAQSGTWFLSFDE